MGKVKEDFLTVRSCITLGAFFTAYGLVWTGHPVPDVILRIVDLLLGFWFGQKATQAPQKKEEQQ